MNILSNAEITKKLTEFKAKYDGKYWNAGLSQKQLSESYWGVTDKGCVDLDNDDEEDCTSNEFGRAWQCHGFAKFLTYCLFGSYPDIRMGYAGGTANLSDDWDVYQNDFSNVKLEPGDFVRLKPKSATDVGHSFIVWSVENEYVQAAECLGGVGCILH